MNNIDQDNSDSFDDEIYEVERLLGHRITNDCYEYLIKWKNYSNEYNTWEKERNIFAKGLILDYWRSKGAMSRDASPQVEENLKEYIINAKLSGKPPEGKTWDDVDHVVNVYNCGSNILFAEIKWKHYSPNDHVNNTFIPTRILRKIYPLKLIEFYQSKIDYKLP
ncbi:hypothetical protein BCV72DRAFT_233093 [Rhizopus microsporus var. microsporus]|uniref:Chromo domain-containing protein n=2 Tax=Rhizopus microsporus TaxID=58291 RepID=A0A2G4SG00_RHIZD|nr:uncharacterized protein RHIMIDRAFT_273965 [Rhizopus microsporus ATCC 52813]ORE03462.1 hypothetical protein BCV72DRAFT_233093 [Rhizopus microsporus var. microsporus]PHZ07692.1 hypothetical protein RHIMIDRAFT_273965 [Rhizopus microsporus ATCC 52813]